MSGKTFDEIKAETKGGLRLPTDWAGYVNRGRRWRKASDDANWGLGDDVVEMCRVLGFDPKPGRPPANSNVRTLTDYAAEVDIQPKRVSECYANSKFYGNSRMSGDYSTWAHHDLARRNAPGKDHEEQLENALELLETAKSLHLHYRAFVRRLQGIVFEGTIETVEDLVRAWNSYNAEGKPLFVTFGDSDDE